MEKQHKTRVGYVVGNKMDKTVVVSVESARRHPRYQKIVRSSAKFMAHDEKKECKPGDLVRISETRPLSKTKRWRVTEIINKGEVVELQPKEIT